MRLHRWARRLDGGDGECISCGTRVTWPGAIRACSGQAASPGQIRRAVERDGWELLDEDAHELRACLNSVNAGAPVFRFALGFASSGYANHGLRGRTGVW